MHCPNCKHILTTVTLENIVIEHCNYCGGSLFEENEINRITEKDAEKLALMKQSDSILSLIHIFSPYGDFIIDTYNVTAAWQKKDLKTAEHRNILFILSTLPYIHATKPSLKEMHL